MDNYTHYSLKITKKLLADLKEYCELNDLKLSGYIESLVSRGFNEDKFGDAPFLNKKPAQQVGFLSSEDLASVINRKSEEFIRKPISELINEPIKEPINEPVKEEELNLRDMVVASLTNTTDKPNEITIDAVKEVLKQAQIDTNVVEDKKIIKKRTLKSK